MGHNGLVANYVAVPERLPDGVGYVVGENQPAFAASEALDGPSRALLEASAKTGAALSLSLDWHSLEIVEVGPAPSP